jgi:tetratricopeptide (TPR) repeat protein
MDGHEFITYSDTMMTGYKDIHKGRRCVIVGNGPSLKKMDLSFLRNEITFGLNRIYLGFEKWDFMPTYYVSVNQLVLKQNMKEILGIPVPKFLGLGSLPFIPDAENVIGLKTSGLPLGDVPVFSKDPLGGIWEGFTVTYVAMQLAYYMGFSEVVLIGVDHFFSAGGKANQEVISTGDDNDHFDPGYFGRGIRWHLPDLENSEVAYRAAKIAFEADGKRIIDATLEGKLTVFAKVDYRKLFFEQKEYAQLHNERINRTDVLVKEAEDKAQNGYDDIAVSRCLKIIECCPEAADAYNILGAVYLKSGDPGKSFRHILKALRINPAHEGAVINLTKLLILAGEEEQARHICSVYLKRDPHGEDIKPALEEIRKKSRLGPGLIQGRDLLVQEINNHMEEILLLISIGNALTAGDNDEAVRLCRGLIKYPDSPDLLNYQAELQFQLGNRKTAKSILLKLIDTWPMYSTAFNNLGVISLEEGDLKKSLQYFTKAFRISPTRETVINCGKLLTHLGSIEEARQLYSAYLEKHPEDEEICTLFEDTTVLFEKGHQI